jgi:NTP pyrophosphatase (non-canonical NTP hydrolase)
VIAALVPVEAIDTWAAYDAEVTRTGGTSPHEGESQEAYVARNVSLCSLGIPGEIGEVVDLVKKFVFHGRVVDDAHRLKLANEIGDVLRYGSHLASTLGRPFGVYMQAITRGTIRRTDRDGVFGSLPVRTLSPDAACRILTVSAAAVVQTLYPSGADVAHDEHADFLTHLGRVVEILRHIGSLYDVTLADAVQANVTKLRVRFPEGFTREAANNRADVVKEG